MENSQIGKFYLVLFGALSCGGSTEPKLPPLGTLPIASVTVSSAPEIQVDQSLQLSATVRDSIGRVLDSAVTWSADNHSPATGVLVVNTTGRATGNLAGPVVVTAKAGGKIGSTTISVINIPADSIALGPSVVGGLVGASWQLYVELYSALPRKGVSLLRRQYRWTMSNPTVAVLDTAGAVGAPPLIGTPAAPLVRFVGKGDCTVTVTVEGRSASARVVGQ